MKTNVVYYKNSQNMSEVEDESITLIVTSPPYWNIKDYSKDGYQKQQRTKRIKGQIGDIEDYQPTLSSYVEQKSNLG